MNISEINRGHAFLPPTVTEMQTTERPPYYPRKVLRFPSLKRNRENVPLNERVKLERILGFTVSSNASLKSDPTNGVVIYPAGCAIVLFNLRKNKQGHILNSSKKTITSLDISPDGKYVVSGECGHLPNVRVWDTQEKVQVAEFSGHKYGINCVAFSPNLKYVVSVGSQHDMIVNVWDWRSGSKVASNKVSSKVKAVAFSESGNYFVTVGNRHVKFWYLECSARPSKYKEPVPLMGRSAILGENRNNYFCDVACGRGDMASSTFSITKSGLLCEFNSRRLLDKWVELRTPSANCLTLGSSLIFIGCADGIVRCFNPYTLEFVTTLPRTHYLGVDVSMGLSISHMASQVPNARYPDTIAITYDESNKKVTCLYSDHSMYVWDVKDIKKVGKSHSFLYHSACIWGVEVYPSTFDSQKPALPPGSFITCSSDDTIRIWNLEPSMPNNTVYRRNIYCNELLKTVYIDEALTYLCDLDCNCGGSNDKMDTTYDTRNGVRCIRISPDGYHLASGDRSGNIRIHELQRMDEVCKIEAHESEVLSLEYSKPDTGHRFLASASRDRLIHVFDVDQDYAFQQTLDDHSSSITAVRFVQNNKQLQMISCGADKSIIFRTAQFTPQLQFARDHHVVGKTTLYDMEVDYDQQHILTACQDRHVRVYDVESGKHAKSFKGSVGEDGTLIKVVLDNSGLFAATSCTDKSLCLYDFSSGECVATMFGHSELVTGLRFTNDCKYLISVSGDGCIFVWKLPLEITHQMQVRFAQLAPKMKQSFRKTVNHHPPVPTPDQTANGGFGPAHVDKFDANSIDDEGLISDYRFSIGPLPKWANKEVTEDSLNSNVSEKSSLNIAQPKGRWAQRIDAQGLVVRSFYSSDHVIPYPSQLLGQANTGPLENSKDTEFRKYTDIRRETIVISKQQTNHKDFSPCPESLQDIQFGSLAKSQCRSPTTVSTKRGSEMITVNSRRRLITDSSSNSSILQLDDFDMEHDHDGDVEDDESGGTDHSTEVDNEIIYYPQPARVMETGEEDFKVRATNPDELRDAHRRMKKGRAERPNDLPIINVHDSDDDDDSGTPQGGGHSIISMLNVSMESLDRVGQREKFMKSTYESLEGDMENEKDENFTSSGLGGLAVADDGEHDDHRQSLSARYLHRSNNSTPLRNIAALNSAKQKEATSQKRKDIMRQVEKTRQKLDTIGWKASMNSSKSIGDLTELPEKDYATGRYYSKDSSTLDSMRRASSMNDLSKPRRLLPPPPTDVASSYSPLSKNYGTKSNDRMRDDHTSRLPNSMSRSSSMGVLNPSESDSDASTANISSSKTSSSRWNSGNSSMRPTISSLNKSIGPRGSHEQLSGTGRVTPSFKSSTGQKQNINTNRRASEVSDKKKMQPLSIDPRRSPGAGWDSSSEETSPTGTRPTLRSSLGYVNSTSTLPRHHGRPPGGRSASTLASSRSRSEKDLSKMNGNDAVSASSRAGYDSPRKYQSASPRGQRSSSNANRNLGNDGHMLEKSPQELPVKDNLPQPIDVTSAPLSRELCDMTALGLKQSADNMLQLYKRITMETELEESEREEMLNLLQESTTQAQQTLRPINSNVGVSSNTIRNTSTTPMKFSEQPSENIPPPLFMAPGKPPADQMQLLKQYTEMLLNMYQKGMGPPT